MLALAAVTTGLSTDFGDDPAGCVKLSTVALPEPAPLGAELPAMRRVAAALLDALTVRPSQAQTRALYAIERMLQALFAADEPRALAWLNASNRAFEGKAPLALMREDPARGLTRVHRYLLDAVSL